MIEIARLPADDRRELFHNTAAKPAFTMPLRKRIFGYA